MDDFTTTVRLPPDPWAKAPARGAIVGGKYRLLRPLGKGGMGLVFEAEHVRLGQLVAIKFLRPDLLTLPDACCRFEREARASARLHGPHVVQVLDVDADKDGLPYIVMERVTGRDLEAELRARGQLPIVEAVDCVLQACAALVEAHAAGIVHRDLKPSNLFLADQCGVRVLKVLDFGISKISQEPDASVTSAASTLGTPLYMSPEQVRSSKDVDERTDIWSLGVILYELLAGAPPFSGSTTAAIAAIVADAVPSLRTLRPDVPTQLDRVIAGALAKLPADRFPTAESLGAALVPFASPEAVSMPFSLRPSARAFAIAIDTMARPMSARHAMARPMSTRPPSRPPELVKPPSLPGSEELGRRVAAAGSIPLRDAVRTFVGTLVLGMGLASGLALSNARAASGGASHRLVTRVQGDTRDTSPAATAAHSASGLTPALSPAACDVIRDADQAKRNLLGRGEAVVRIAAAAPPATALVVPTGPPGASRPLAAPSPASPELQQSSSPLITPSRE